MKIIKKKIFHPIFQLFAIAIIVFFYSTEFEIFNLNKFISIIIFLLTLYITITILDVKICTEIKKDKILSGIYVNSVGFIKINEKINFNEISEIVLSQNEKKYFEIKIIKKDNKIFVINSLANKFPANKLIEEIKNKIKNVG